MHHVERAGACVRVEKQRGERDCGKRDGGSSGDRSGIQGLCPTFHPRPGLIPGKLIRSHGWGHCPRRSDGLDSGAAALKQIAAAGGAEADGQTSQYFRTASAGPRAGQQSTIHRRSLPHRALSSLPARPTTLRSLVQPCNTHMWQWPSTCSLAAAGNAPQAEPKVQCDPLEGEMDAPPCRVRLCGRGALAHPWLLSVATPGLRLRQTLLGITTGNGKNAGHRLAVAGGSACPEGLPLMLCGPGRKWGTRGSDRVPIGAPLGLQAPSGKRVWSSGPAARLLPLTPRATRPPRHRRSP